jgi:NAD-dependent dihydropyrimidine dehydrogenase PreA subunit
MQNKKVTICACVSRSFIDKDKVTGIAVAFEKNGYAVTIEADLCKKVMQRSPDMNDIAAGIIMACYPRAIRSHFNWLDIEIGQVIDIRNNGYNDILSPFEIPCSDADNINGKKIFRKKIEQFTIETGIDAWYPTIDKKKCSECGKCHDFCLFGVYTIENKKVKVVNPQNCKNNCPACARICSNQAIIFPKYEKSPINGGTIQEEVFNPEEMDKMYRERLRIRLQQRRAGISLLKENNK